ncbi:MAG: class I SAM-dependent methyltransferase [Brevefilum sp.]
MMCPLCQAEKTKIFEQVQSFGYPLTYYQCENCGLVFQSVDESQATDSDFYAETYRKIYQGDPEPTAKDLYVQKDRAENLIAYLEEQKNQKLTRILDVGASSGMLLAVFRSAFGCQTTGVEPGDAYRSYAESQGLDMSPSLEALIAVDAGRYDLVSMIHVLEHLPDPVGTLRLIREKLLADGGTLLVEVPNFYTHDSYELAHLACFTPHTLKEILRQAGFHVNKLKRHGEPRSDLLNLYLTVLAVPAENNARNQKVKSEGFVRLKRRLGMLYRRLVQKLFPHKAWRPLPVEKER